MLISYDIGKFSTSEVLQYKTVERFEYTICKCQAKRTHSLEASTSATEPFLSNDMTSIKSLSAGNNL